MISPKERKQAQKKAWEKLNQLKKKYGLTPISFKDYLKANENWKDKKEE